MPISPPLSESALSYTALDLITDAFIEIGACPPGEEPSPDESQWGFRQLNDLVDIWQAKAVYVYSFAFNLYTLVAQLSPHTIGPSGQATFDTLGQPRPVRIESAAQLLNPNSQPGPTDLPIRIRDRAWWAAQQTKSIQTNVVTDLYYDPTAPDGSLFFWPVPDAQAQVRLQLWQTVSQFESVDDPIGGPNGPGTLPPAYRSALKFSLAEMLLPGANREAHPVLVAKALAARTAIGLNNAKSPRMSTQDSGMPRAGRRGTRGDFNWVTGGMAGGPPE